MELVEIIRGAQAAMDRGDYRVAASACSHVLETFPACVTAHRLLGEAYLEQGETDAAIEHFNQTIQTDPLNVVARLGLGVASEEKRRMEEAYTAYLHAWEINPALEQVRDELVRLRGLLNGDERLHPTRAGLAGIYERGGQFGRAAAEWRAVLAADPDNPRARTAIAEVLWRSGDDAGAAAACRESLTAEPDNARALAILTDIESRRGASVASELASRYQVIDPAGEIATLLAEWRGDFAVDALRRESIPVADFDFAAVPADRFGQPSGGAVTGLVSSQFAAPDLWDSLVQDLRDDGSPASAGAPLADDVQPFSWIDEGASPGGDLFGLDTLLEARPAPAPAAAAMAATASIGAAAATASLEDQLAAMSGAPGLAAPAAPERPAPGPMAGTVPFAMPEAAAGPPARTMASQPAAPAESPPTDPAPAPSDPFVTADGRVDLTVGWDDLDRQLREATPSHQNNSEIDALAAELGVAGIVPFDAGESGFDTSAWAPFSDDDLGQLPPAAPAVQPVAVAEPPAFTGDPVPAPADPVLFGNDAPPMLGFDDPVVAAEPAVDDRIVEQIPAPRRSGYTELLRNIDAEEIPVFGGEEMIDPFANPDAAGSPLQFEELLAVTSKDGTAPLSPVVDGGALPLAEATGTAPALDDLPAEFRWSDEPAVEPPVALPEPAVAAAEPFADVQLDEMLAGLGDLEPFSLDDGPSSAAAPHDAIDFSEINEAPFDPASLAGVVAAPTPVVTNGWHAQPAQPVVEPEPSEHWVELTAEPAELAGVTAGVAAIEAAPLEMPTRRGTNGLGVPASAVAWPAFMGHTSDLIDREAPGENLFARLRDAKRQGIAAGLIQVDRALTARPPIAEERVQVISVPASRPARSASRVSTLTEAERIDLMTLRVRLIEDDSSAQEVATALERAIAGGLHDALALRVLGEAYLKLGRTEQAAAQFRQAMLMRQRART